MKWNGWSSFRANWKRWSFLYMRVCAGWHSYLRPCWSRAGFILAVIASFEAAGQEPCAGSSWSVTWDTGAMQNLYNVTTGEQSLYAPVRLRISAEWHEGYGYMLQGMWEPLLAEDTETKYEPPKPLPDLAIAAWLQQQVADAGPSSVIHCVMTNLIPNVGLMEYPGAERKRESDIGWLYGDADEDGLNNMLDPDQQLDCILLMDPWDFDGCDGIVLYATEQEELWTVTPTPIPDVPQITSTEHEWFACGTPTYSGGAATYVDTYQGNNGESITLNWALAYWKDRARFGTPDHDPPYWNPYNLVRAGAGGAVSAYFSAPWGKELHFMNVNATDTSNAIVEKGDIVWHRYVIMENEQATGPVFHVQYWRPGDGCWTDIGINLWVTDNSGDYPFACEVKVWQNAMRLNYYVPRGYFPGDLVNETDSNVVNGQYSLPSWETVTGGASFDNAIPAVLGGLGGGGGGLTQDEMAAAFYDALGEASGGMAADGANAMMRRLGQGGDGSAQYIFGEGYHEDGGGSVGAAQAGVDSAGGSFGTAVQAALRLDDLSPEAQAMGSFPITFPKPGGGDIAFNLVTLPDTDTAMGTALEGVRLFVRLGLTVLVIYKFTMGLISLYREVT